MVEEVEKAKAVAELAKAEYERLKAVIPDKAGWADCVCPSGGAGMIVISK